MLELEIVGEVPCVCELSLTVVEDCKGGVKSSAWATDSSSWTRDFIACADTTTPWAS